MERSVAEGAASGAEVYELVASRGHTILMLAAVAAWAVSFQLLSLWMKMAAHPARVPFYLVAILLEWVMLGIVVAGVRHHGASVYGVIGERWRSVRQVLRDIGIGAGFWVVAMVLLWVFSKLLGIHGSGPNLRFLFPHGAEEIAVWIAVSASAGICEEAIFRGYLQRQFTALTKNVPVGIVLSAAVFGAAHAYQGVRMVILIALYGAMFGILAHWRRSVRPGMIVHAWHDALSGIAGGLGK